MIVCEKKEINNPYGNYFLAVEAPSKGNIAKRRNMKYISAKPDNRKRYDFTQGSDDEELIIGNLDSDLSLGDDDEDFSGLDPAAMQLDGEDPYPIDDDLKDVDISDEEYPEDDDTLLGDYPDDEDIEEPYPKVDNAEEIPSEDDEAYPTDDNEVPSNNEEINTDEEYPEDTATNEEPYPEEGSGEPLPDESDEPYPEDEEEYPDMDEEYPTDTVVPEPTEVSDTGNEAYPSDNTEEIYPTNQQQFGVADNNPNDGVDYYSVAKPPETGEMYSPDTMDQTQNDSEDTTDYTDDNIGNDALANPTDVNQPVDPNAMQQPMQDVNGDGIPDAPITPYSDTDNPDYPVDDTDYSADTGDDSPETQGTIGLPSGKGPDVGSDSMRRYNLFKEFIALLNAIDIYIDRLDNALVDDQEQNYIIKSCVDKLKETRQQLYDYLMMKFELSSYERNNYQFQSKIITVQLIFDLLEKINLYGEKKDAKKKRRKKSSNKKKN